MERLKEVFDNVNNRIQNPLLFSFIVAWVVSNWRIIVALFWYDTSQIENSGYDNMFGLIEDLSSAKYGIIYPGIAALIYTFLLPLISNFMIKPFTAWVNGKGETRSLNISGTSKVAMDRFIALRDNYKERSSKLEELIADEQKYVKSAAEAEDKVREQIDRNTKLTHELTELKKHSHFKTDVSELNGDWINYFEQTHGPNKFNGKEIVLIENGKYYKVKAGEKLHLFDIEHYVEDPRSQEVFFVKNRTNMKELHGPNNKWKYYINELKINDDGSLEGIENGTIKIKYVRRN